MKSNIHRDRILVLDFGSQYTQLILRRIRDLGVYCELFSWNIKEEQIREFNPNGIILSGGPESTTQVNSPHAARYVFESGIPVLGICYGMQTMVMQLGGHVTISKKRELGHARVRINADSILTRDIKDTISEKGKPILDVWMSYSDVVTIIPRGFIAIASTKTCPFAIIADEEKKLYGIQFHPEVTHTRQGMYILKRFVKDICHCQTFWISTSIIDDIIMYIHQQVRDDKVILGLSGGVDSSVTAMLLHRAIGKNLICIFIDNGLLRLNEANQVMDMFHKNLDLNIIYISAEDRFLSALKGKTDPEEKRKIIGRVFIQIFNEEALKLGNIKWFAQGTIYPDVIESSVSITGKTHIIKSHHNVGGIPKGMTMKLLEPLKKLFKDEVRKIGIELGLSRTIIDRHPFPGPGLGIRILGEIRKEYCNLLRRTDDIFIEELQKAGLYDKISQAFTVFLPIRSVGIMGDCRKYNWVISLRAVESIDFMTVNWAYLPHTFLNKVSSRIINEINEISRVVYDISGKPPATIEWE